jgi:hypothetical protein
MWQVRGKEKCIQGFDGVSYTKQNNWNTSRVSWGALHKTEQLKHIKGFMGCPTQNRTIGTHQVFDGMPYTKQNNWNTSSV